WVDKCAPDRTGGPGVHREAGDIDIGGIRPQAFIVYSDTKGDVLRSRRYRAGPRKGDRLRRAGPGYGCHGHRRIRDRTAIGRVGQAALDRGRAGCGGKRCAITEVAIDQVRECGGIGFREEVLRIGLPGLKDHLLWGSATLRLIAREVVFHDAAPFSIARGGEDARVEHAEGDMAMLQDTAHGFDARTPVGTGIYIAVEEGEGSARGLLPRIPPGLVSVQPVWSGESGRYHFDVTDDDVWKYSSQECDVQH